MLVHEINDSRTDNIGPSGHLRYAFQAPSAIRRIPSHCQADESCSPTAPIPATSCSSTTRSGCKSATGPPAATGARIIPRRPLAADPRPRDPVPKLAPPGRRFSSNWRCAASPSLKLLVRDEVDGEPERPRSDRGATNAKPTTPPAWPAGIQPTTLCYRGPAGMEVSAASPANRVSRQRRRATRVAREARKATASSPRRSSMRQALARRLHPASSRATAGGCPGARRTEMDARVKGDGLIGVVGHGGGWAGGQATVAAATTTVTLRCAGRNRRTVSGRELPRTLIASRDRIVLIEVPPAGRGGRLAPSVVCVV